MRRRQIAVAIATAIAIPVLISTPAQASTPDAAAPASTVDKDLQRRVDEVLAAIPGGEQVSATEVRYDGLRVTVDPFFSESLQTVNAISCPHEWFCIDVNGTRFEFYTCTKWKLSNWTDFQAAWNNNQTNGTLAYAFAGGGDLVVWQSRAKSSGSTNVNPWFWFKPCGNE